jgi:mannitol-1-phosphate/altronate dehydrogenase
MRGTEREEVRVVGSVSRVIDAANELLWGTDLSQVPGFTAAVSDELNHMLAHGVRAALEAHMQAAEAGA